MSTLADAIKAKMTADTVLMALATGGVHSSHELDENGLTRDLISQVGVVGVSPSIYIEWRTVTPYGVAQRLLRAENVFFEVFFYHHQKYDTIGLMRDRVRTLLEYQNVKYTVPANRWVADIYFIGDILNSFDSGLNATMERTRYQVLQTINIEIKGDC